ncbi:unnamed protein product [Heligmosomoides polygyrus]|uniref:Ovule protein n=1 Tax=Heligmosomoides polygyrus TaxID=6339 RepID=A0A183G280_HELPZ|nr:unnamed protein product [Heligmosomoides polygyrus]
MQSRNSLQLEFLEQCMLGDELKVRNMLNSHMVDTSYHHPVNGCCRSRLLCHHEEAANVFEDFVPSSALFLKAVWF